VTNWEEVAVPRGAYIGWGSKDGQHVTGKVMDYSLDGGTDFAQNPCPSIAIELTETAASFNKEGERTDHAIGDLVQLNAGQVSLKRALRAADPKPGDLVKITLKGIVKTASGGTVKEFDMKIARGAGGPVTPAPAPAAAGGFGGGDDEPPF
jgi:hypothetical protein